MSCNHHPRALNRRHALSMLGGGFGMVAFSNMVTQSIARADSAIPGSGVPGVLTGKLHFKPKPSASSSFS